MNELLAQLDDVFDIIGKETNPPISDVELKHLSSGLPFSLSPQVESLFKWHNGIDEFIPNYDLLSFSEAVEHYSSFSDYRRLTLDRNHFKESYLPILIFDVNNIF